MYPKKRPFFNPYIQAALNLAIKGPAFFISKYVKGPLKVLHPFAPAVVTVAFLTYDLWKPFIRVQSVEEYSVDIFRHYFLISGRQNIIDRRIALSSSFLEGEGKGPRFQYPPLASRTMIRLLKLQAREGKPGRVVSELVEIDIDDTLAYDAISYIWGSSSLEYSLAVGDEIKHYIPITKSAYHVLREVTPLRGCRHVWIDSICINQEDKSEKDVQIPHMNKIYGNAAEVIVCLDNLPTAATAVSFLSRFYWYYMSKDLNIMGRTYKSDGDLQASFTTTLPFLKETQNWEAWRDLVNNNYWTRVWIIQECVVAKEITIICDGIPLAWDILVLSSLVLRSSVSRVQNEIVRSACLAIERIALVLANRFVFLKDGPPRPLVELIVEFSEFRATEPKDKINALLGISQAAEVPALQPDYRKSLQEVYAEVVKFSLEAGSFRTFCISGLSQRQRDDTSSELPSWVPQLISSYTSATGRYHDEYTAGFGLPVEFEMSGQRDQLSLKGVYLDTITTTASDPDISTILKCSFEAMDIHDALSFGTEVVGRIIEMLRLFELHLPTVKHQYKDSDEREAFWQTITDDFDGKGLPDREELDQILKTLESFAAMWTGEQPPEEDKISSKELISVLSSDLAKTKFWPENGGIVQAAELLVGALCANTFAITKRGFMAFAPAGTKPGDIIVIFNGSPVPHILRPNKESNSSYFLWGEAYVHGVMSGEAMSAEQTWFVLR